jgi:hypothetical protein
MSPLQFAQLSPHEERRPSPEPSFHNLQGSQQRSPLQVPFTELPQKEQGKSRITAAEIKCSRKNLNIHAVSPQKVAKHFERSLNTSSFVTNEKP